ncbi:MAG TPA: sugar phosphate isomerase/epimerase family protein [Candidatus Limnocylindrales bacterium]|nr:sugar phosphate isomerase/epimerase family protein [Candidatus Limnocylindrales bacterium]
MNDWPVGLSTGCFYQKSIFDCLEPIRHNGFSMLEICSFPAHLDYHDLDAVRRAAKRIEELGMEAYSFHAPFAEHIDITALNSDQRGIALQEILKAAEAAAILQVRYFVIHPGPEQEQKSDLPCAERFQRMQNAASTLDRVAQRCGELGIGCVLENKLPHLLLGGTSDILWVLGAMNAINVGTCLDTGHAYLSGDLYKVMHKLSGHLQMIHANDNHGTFDDHKAPGEGKIDWKRLLMELSQIEFQGGFILELSGDKPLDIVLTEARRARRYLREISRQLALSCPPTVNVARPKI